MTLKKGIEVKFFTVEQNLVKSLKCCFQDIAVQSQQLPLTSVLSFYQYGDRRLTFGKMAYIYFKAAILQF